MLKHFKGDSITVKKGEPIEIPADVLGLPIPKIEWTKDDVVIAEPTENLLMETVVTGRMNCKTTLSIPAVNRRDRGSYTVTASNNMGSAKHTIFVMVLGELKHATDSIRGRKDRMWLLVFKMLYILTVFCSPHRPATSTQECYSVQHQGRVLLPPVGRTTG